MEIRDISTNPLAPVRYKPLENIQRASTKQAEADEKKPKEASPAWQKNILLSALDNLENSIQVDNSHPLDYAANSPIEKYEEALIELKFARDSILNGVAGKAQANINPENIVSLFTE